MIATGNHFHFDSLRDAPPSLNVRLLNGKNVEKS